MMSMQQNDLEHKQADSLRADKDDFKRQSVELRKSRGIAGADTLDDPAFTHPQLSADPLAPRATVPLEPTVQAPRKIEHTDLPSTSIASSSASSTTTSSGPALMEQVGEQTGASIEAAKAKLEPLIAPVVAKATSIYDQWKADDSSAPSSTGPTIQERATIAGADIKERATIAATQAQTLYNDKLAPAMTDAANKAGPMLSNAAAQAKPLLAQASAQAQVAAAQARPVIENAIEQAKPILANAAATAQKIYAEQVQPALVSGLTAAQEQIGVMREDGLSVTMEKAGTAYQRRVATAKTAINETYEAKVPLEQRQQIAAAQKTAVKQLRFGWNRALDIWETQAQPLLREYSAKGMIFIRERKLQAPLGIASAVLLLLLGWSILSSLSASRASHEQVVVYQPDWRPSNGPVQGVEMPGVLDKAKMHLHAADSKIVDGIDMIKARTADLAQHAEDEISMGIDSIKVKAQELKDSIPSTADIKARADSTLEAARAAMPGSKPAPIVDDSVLGSIKSGAADLKARVNSAIHPAEPSTMDQIKDSASATLELNKLRAENAKLRAQAQIHSARASIPSAADIKERINSAIHPAEPSTMDQIKSGAADLKERINSAIHPAEPSTMDQIKSGAADLKARVNSAIHPAEPSTMDQIKSGAADLKARVNSAIHPAEPSVLDQIKDGAADLKNRAESAVELAKLRAENVKLRAEAELHSTRASIPSTADIKARAESTLESARASIPSGQQATSTTERSQLRLKINDRVEHIKHLLPEQLSALKQRLGGVYERLTPAQRHYAHAHPEILDPENHAVSFVDAHGNVKSILDVDLE